jgi:acyl-CoA synthetase (AMP-forming)/AMP-acid ligase II
VRDVVVALQPGRPDRLAAGVASDHPPAALRAALRECLAPWKIPRRVVVMAAFPLNPRGKPDRRQLVERMRDR